MADYTDVLKLSALPTLEVKTGFKRAIKASFFDTTQGTATTRPTTGGQIYPRSQ